MESIDKIEIESQVYYRLTSKCKTGKSLKEILARDIKILEELIGVDEPESKEYDRWWNWFIL